ncbi:MAG: hypothetical protein ACRDM7_12845 [Thermoleophilaceae bacterium]
MSILNGPFIAAADARAKCLRALTSTAQPAEAAAALASAADATRGTGAPETDSPTAELWRAYAAALDVLAHFERWEAGVRAADPGADAAYRAATRNAQLAGRQLEEAEGRYGASFAPASAQDLQAILNDAAQLTDPDNISGLKSRLLAVALPQPHTKAKRQQYMGRPASAPEPDPLALCTITLQDEPITHAHVIPRNLVHKVGVRARLTVWPAWADELRIEFLSVLQQPSQLTAPAWRLRRPERDAEGYWTVQAEGALSFSVAQPLGQAPASLRLAVSLIGDGRTEHVACVGYEALQLHITDPSAGTMSGQTQLDERLLRIFESTDAGPYPDEEKLAFRRMLTGLARVAASMHVRRDYATGAEVAEDVFHRDLLKQLDMQPELTGRVWDGRRQGGGPTDLIHDMINAELKVEKNTTATLENAHRYLGQPTQYAASSGAQLTILCILDMTAKQSPVGVVGNYIGLIEPALHGLTDPAYPSRVAVVIINGNLPLPSDWAGTKIAHSVP